MVDRKEKVKERREPKGSRRRQTVLDLAATTKENFSIYVRFVEGPRIILRTGGVAAAMKLLGEIALLLLAFLALEVQGE